MIKISEISIYWILYIIKIKLEDDAAMDQEWMELEDVVLYFCLPAQRHPSHHSDPPQRPPTETIHILHRDE